MRLIKDSTGKYFPLNKVECFGYYEPELFIWVPSDDLGVTIAKYKDRPEMGNTVLAELIKWALDEQSDLKVFDVNTY